MSVHTDSFRTTRWSLVLQARADATEPGAALAELCDAYYRPVRAYIRANVSDPECARDRTQEFFARVLRGGAFDQANPARGRFRSFILGAVKHFLANAHDRDHALKRGGNAEIILIEPATDTSPGFEPPDDATMLRDALFDREWAITLLDRALQILGEELAAEGKGEQFAVLKPWLTGDVVEAQSAAAARLALNENAVKVAIHRLRKRFREIVKAEIAQTVDGAAERQAELQHLIAALAVEG